MSEVLLGNIKGPKGDKGDQGDPAAVTRPVLYTPSGLRRGRKALSMADRQIVPIVVIGDSVAWGIGADGTSATASATAAADGFTGRLAGYFGSSPRTLLSTPGLGFLGTADTQVTKTGTPIQSNYAVTALGQGHRLVAATQSLTITVPTGVTSVGVIQGNANVAFNTGHSGLADVTGQYSINGGTVTNLTTLTNTNLPLVTNIAVTAGQTLKVQGPATAQTFISGFIYNNAATKGVQVHRVAVAGSVSGLLLGGQSAGVLQVASGFQSTAAQAAYKYCSTPGVIVICFGLNDQQFQNGGGAGSQNGVTQTLYTAWIQQFANQAITDGWCVLLLGEPRNSGNVPGFPQLDDYYGAEKGIAAATDHVSYADIGEMWGGYTASQAAGLQLSSSAHANENGHGDIAWMLYDILNRAELPEKTAA